MISQWFWKGCWILHDIGCWWILDKNGSKWIFGDPTPKKVFVKGVQTNEAVLVPHISGNVSKFAALHWTIPRNQGRVFVVPQIFGTRRFNGFIWAWISWENRALKGNSKISGRFKCWRIRQPVHLKEPWLWVDFIKLIQVPNMTI